MLTTYPAWAALSAGNMAALRLAGSSSRSSSAPTPSRGIGSLTLADRLRAEGREARVLVPERQGRERRVAGEGRVMAFATR